ncbi:MAG: hypothetical protein JSV82_07625 [Planctomycetota bacterium]|nr:MAG: hypothetical protein JSV82_07625 [Planctomycetota bacterium]
MKRLRIRTVVGSIFIVCGVFWLIMFPKTSDVLRPDFVISAALGIGLIVTGVLFLLFKKSKMLVGTVFIFLLWSVLLNVCLLATIRHTLEFIKETTQTACQVQTESPTP